MAVGPTPRKIIAAMSEAGAAATSRTAAGATGTVASTPAMTPQNVAERASMWLSATFCTSTPVA